MNWEEKIHALISAAFGLMVSVAIAGDYPERPIRFIVPTTQGGGADTLARNIAIRVTDHWKQQVIVDNRSGANGITGLDAAAKATPDGYT